MVHNELFNNNQPKLLRGWDQFLELLDRLGIEPALELRRQSHIKVGLQGKRYLCDQQIGTSVDSEGKTEEEMKYIRRTNNIKDIVEQLSKV